MTKTSLILAAAALALSSPIALGQSQPIETAQKTATTLTVNVKGMVCDFCARAVTKVFGKNEAVENVHVDLDNGEIHVGLKPGASLTDDEVETLVKKSGYAMVSVERDVS
ncbi:MAG: heavy-metal-associated domain-containing protein [Henriciella sp.]|nr:heavy-metal-associated domain-containing protein [Henriciella sp.]